MSPEPTTSAIFRALRSVNVDSELAHEAAEETRHEAGQNVIAVVGAQIEAQSARIEALGARIDSQIAELRVEMKAETAEIRARIDAHGARIDALGSRIDTLQKVIWPLIAILAASILGLLYKAVTS